MATIFRKANAIASIIIWGLLICLNSLSAAPATTVSHYKLVNKIHLAGDAGWDYLCTDDSTGRIFVSHGMQVDVVDEKSAKLLGSVPDTKGVHGIALAYDLNKGYTSNGKDSSVTVFNLKTLAVETQITGTGQNPDAIIYDTFSHKVFTFNGRSSNATAINTHTGKIVGTIPLDGKPEFPAIDGKGMVYVNIEDKNEICVINAKTLKVEQTWPIAPGQEASGLAIDTEHHRLFSVCHNKMMVILDTKSGKVVSSLPIGERVDAAAYDPIYKRAYSSNGDGTLTVIQETAADSCKVLENVATQKGARTMALDLKTHHVFLPTAEFGDAPAPTAENPHPRPPVKPDTFVLLEFETVN